MSIRPYLSARNQPGANAVVRILPSLTDLAFLLPILFLFVQLDGARTMLGDGDTGWHVRAGEWMLRNGRVPRSDFFSYTMPGRPWFAWEWLWELSFGWLHKHWGLAAVVVASILLLCVTFTLLFRLVLRSCENRFLAILVTGFVAAGSSLHWLARPHLFTFLFVILFAWIWEDVRAGRNLRLWILPVLMVIWTNVHGGFLTGFVLLGSWTAGELATVLLNSDVDERRAALKRFRLLLAVSSACAAATFINPYFYHLHVHIYQYLRSPFLWQNIQEFRPLDFQHPAALYFEPVFFLGLLAAGQSLYRKQFGRSLLLLVWAHLSLFSVRNLPIFLLVAAPAVAEVLEDGLRQIEGSSLSDWVRRRAAGLREAAQEFAAIDRLPRIHAVSLAAAFLLVVAFALPLKSRKFVAEYDPANYPAKALPVLRDSEFHRIFTHDEWGDYLIYHLYPAKQVFVDGRSDFYGDSFDKKYIDVMRVKYGWEESLNRYQVDTILLPVDEPLTGALKQSAKWRVIYDDGVSLIFRPSQAGSEEPHKPISDTRVAASRSSHADILNRPRKRS